MIVNNAVAYLEYLLIIQFCIVGKMEKKWICTKTKKNGYVLKQQRLENKLSSNEII